MIRGLVPGTQGTSIHAIQHPDDKKEKKKDIISVRAEI